jgi:hypothetical protein
MLAVGIDPDSLKSGFEVIARFSNANLNRGMTAMNTLELAHGYAIEEGTALQVRIEEIDQAFESEFIGAADDDHILISFAGPMGFAPELLQVGMIVSVYYLADDIYHMFNTRFAKIVAEPLAALALQAPKEVLNIERRSQRRLHCTLPARVDVRKTLALKISDINHKGCRLIADAAATVRLEPSDRVLLRIRAPEAPHGYIVEGQIRNVIQKGDQFEAGVLFDTLPATLKSFIESLPAGDK